MNHKWLLVIEWALRIPFKMKKIDNDRELIGFSNSIKN